MFVGSVVTSCPGNTRNIVNGVTAKIFGSNIIKLSFDPGAYRNRYYAIWLNGVWQGPNVYAPAYGNCEITYPAPFPASDISLYIMECGQFKTFTNYIPDYYAKTWDANTSQCLQMSWQAAYTVGSTRGDSQLSSITINGASRVSNVTAYVDTPTRAEIYYTITTVGSTHIVRWYSGANLLAEGSRVGNGAVTCNAMNSSGFSASATLTYTADVVANVAKIELQWPASYQVHYSTSPINTLPRTPEATVTDNGNDAFVYLSPPQTPGSYNYLVLEVSDEGISQTSVIPPSDSPLVINTVPKPATGVTIGGTAGAPTLSWTIGQSGCTYTIYTSKINGPVNFGDYTNPAPITTAVDANFANLAALTGYAPVDRTSYLATIKSSFDSAVATANTAFGTPSTFAAAVTTLQNSLISALNTFGASMVNVSMQPYIDGVTSICTNLAAYVATIPTADATAWSNAVGVQYGSALAYFGTMLLRTPARYTLPNGAIPGNGAGGGAAVGTGTNPLGQATIPNPSIDVAISELLNPIVLPGTFRVVIRATLAGIQETTDTEYLCTFTAAGAIAGLMPNPAFVTKVTMDTGLNLNVYASVLDDNSLTPAAFLDLYVVTYGSTIDTTTAPQASAGLAAPTANFNLQNGIVSYTVPSAGNYTFAIVSRSAGGVRNPNYVAESRYITNVAPTGANAIKGKVIRGKGING